MSAHSTKTAGLDVWVLLADNGRTVTRSGGRHSAERAEQPTEQFPRICGEGEVNR